GATQVFAFANIETRELAAGGQSRPDNAVGIDVHAAWIEAAIRDSEDRGLAGFRRIVAALQANQHAGIRIFADSPNRIVNRAWNNGVQVVTDHRVELGIVWSRRPAASTATSTAAPACCRRGRRSAATGVTLVEQ